MLINLAIWLNRLRSSDMSQIEIDPLSKRRAEMFHALRVSALLFLGFLFITQQVLTRGWLYQFDHYVLHLKNPQFKGLAGHILIGLDDLGLRWFTATVLLICDSSPLDRLISHCLRCSRLI